MVLSGDVKSEKWFKKMMQIVIIQIMTDHDGYRRWYLTLGIQGGGVWNNGMSPKTKPMSDRPL